ncbi:MAG: hypothetical protein HZA50_11995 [Planctomycetes bacterium]|nr:hypothetical protein [Planctomycetota bacterium]
MKNATIFLAALAAAFLPAISAARAGQPAPQDSQAIRKVQDSQREAQQMSREIATEMISMRLRQLEDNGLTDIPIYEDLKAMHSRLDDVANKIIPEVMELLDKAAQAKPEDRPKLIAQMLGKKQKVLLALLAEQERLRMRRQQAELTARLTEIIGQQKKTRESTLKLTGADIQETLVVVDNQKTVAVLYGKFMGMLEQAAGWSGEAGAIAGETRRNLLKANLPGVMSSAVDQLNVSKFTDAAKIQADVLDALNKVLAFLRRLEEKLQQDATSLEAVRQLLKQQQQLKNKVAAGEMSGKESEIALIEQNSIKLKIQEVGNKVSADKSLVDLADRSAASAGQARQLMFDQSPDKAVEQQGRVIGYLAEMEKRLADKLADQKGNKSAKELDALAALMQQALLNLQQALKIEVAIAQELAGQAAKAAQDQKSVVGILADAASKKELPMVVTARVETAHQQAQSTVQSIEKNSPDRSQAVQETEKAIRKAIAELASALAETKRDSLATKLGELNRAAEALDRASATARQTANDLKPKPPQDKIDKAKEDLNNVNEVTDKISQALEKIADDAAKTVKEANQSGQEAGKNLPAKTDDAAKKSQEAAGKMDQAINQIHKEMEKTALELEKTSQTELTHVEDLKNKIEKTMQEKPNPSSKDLNELARLASETQAPIASALEQASDAAKALPPDNLKTEQTKDEAKDSVDKEMQRANVLTDMKKENLNEQLELAKEMLELARQQQKASEQIAETGKKLDSKMEQNPQGDEEANKLAEELQKAMEDYAQSTTELGQDVEEMTGRQEMANRPLRQALDAASKLGGRQLPQKQEPGNQPQDQANQDQANQDQANQDQANQDQANQDQANQNQQGQQQQNNQMGNTMTPQSAMQTAQMMAGERNAQMAQNAARQAQQQQQGQNQQGQNQNQNNQQQNQQRSRSDQSKDPQLTPGGQRAGDAGGGKDDKKGDTWFTSLPQATRDSMKSSGKQTPPPGYEERLEQYFGGSE